MRYLGKENKKLLVGIGFVLAFSVLKANNNIFHYMEKDVA